MTLVLKRASASRLSDEWNDDDFDVFADGGARDALRESGPRSWRGSKPRLPDLALPRPLHDRILGIGVACAA